MKKLRVVFMGTPTFSIPILQSLIENTDVVLVVSQPNKDKDRRGNVIKTPISLLALENNIEVFQPENIKNDYQYILDKQPDIIITCAYGQIIPKIILDYPKYGCINVHGSLLPKLRGGAPIHHAIIDGEQKTGITIMYMDEGMDSGDIISQREVLILKEDNLDSLYKKMSYVGADLLIDTLPKILDGTNDRIKQDKLKVTYGFNIKKEEEKIVFDNKCKKIYNQIRGLSTIPGAYCLIDDLRMKVYFSEVTNVKSTAIPGTITKIDKTGMYISTQDYDIIFSDIKIEGKKRCLVKDFINGIKKEEYLGKVLK